MAELHKTWVSTGVYWVEAPSAGMRILCGCPADVVKHLMKAGLIGPCEAAGVVYETGPNAILLSDVMVQNGAFSNLAEFPVLQMLYRQGMLLPGHPGNTGAKPLLIGSRGEVMAQMQYIHRGNYGLISEMEMIEAGLSAAEAREMMRLKRKFAFGAIRDPSDLLDTLVVDSGPAVVCDGLTIRRVRSNVYEFALGSERVVVDLNLRPNEVYASPYPLDFTTIPRESFAVVHSGEGDGWDINRPSMGSLLMHQGRIFLIDAGPNIRATLDALGVGVNEIEGIFHTHSHDDHFAGLTSLIHSDHRIKYYATPLVKSAVAKKMASLLSINESAFSEYFHVHLLYEGRWNDIDGLQVRPVFSPHPVETTLFFFRTQAEGRWHSYAHMADICRLSLLSAFVTDDPLADGVSDECYRRVAAEYAVPADVKKLDIGGGAIHGDAEDFRNDTSGRIVLAHTAQPLTPAQLEVGEPATFGSVDVLVPADPDLKRRLALDVLRVAFPDVPDEELLGLLTYPVVTVAPGGVLLRERQATCCVWVVLSGSVEAVPSAGGVHSMLSAGAIVGELSGLFDAPASETYRARGYVTALEIPTDTYGAFVDRNGLLGDITCVLERREFLHRTWLFGEVASTKTLNTIARDIRSQFLAEGCVVDVGPDSMGIVVRGRIGRFLGERMVGSVGPGDFFGEEMSVFWTPGVFRLHTIEPTELMIVPAAAVAGVPSIRWRLFEAWGKRMSVYVEGVSDDSSPFRWRETYRLNVLAIDNQHRRLCELSCAAAEAAAPGGDPDTLAEVLRALEEYILYHFGEEEALLERTNYSAADIHRSAHARMAAAVAEMREAVRDGRRTSAQEVEDFLRNIVATHICEDDQLLGGFLNAKGIY